MENSVCCVCGKQPVDHGIQCESDHAICRDCLEKVVIKAFKNKSSVIECADLHCKNIYDDADLKHGLSRVYYSMLHSPMSCLGQSLPKPSSLVESPSTQSSSPSSSSKSSSSESSSLESSSSSPPSLLTTPSTSASASSLTPISLPTSKPVVRVNLYKGRIFEKWDLWGKGDPYVFLMYNVEISKSTVQYNTQDPVWNQEFCFDLVAGDIALTFDVWDEDPQNDDHIGACKVQDITLYSSTQRLSIDLKNPKGKIVGTLDISIWLDTVTEGQEIPHKPSTPKFLSTQSTFRPSTIFNIFGAGSHEPEPESEQPQKKGFLRELGRFFHKSPPVPPKDKVAVLPLPSSSSSPSSSSTHPAVAGDEKEGGQKEGEEEEEVLVLKVGVGDGEEEKKGQKEEESADGKKKAKAKENEKEKEKEKEEEEDDRFEALREHFRIEEQMLLDEIEKLKAGSSQVGKEASIWHKKINFKQAVNMVMLKERSPGLALLKEVRETPSQGGDGGASSSPSPSPLSSSSSSSSSEKVEEIVPPLLVGGGDVPPPPPLLPLVDDGGGAVPPPPPLLLGGAGEGGIPPPPPAAVLGGIPKKRAIKPAKPMKVFHWSRIPDKDVAGTVWKTLSDDKVDINIEELEGLFAKKVGADVLKERSYNASPFGESSASVSSPLVVSAPAAAATPLPPAPLLSAKRLQSVGIMLSKFGGGGSGSGTQTAGPTPEEIAEAVERCDMAMLTPERVQALYRNIPGEDEVATLKAFTGDVSTRSKPERFLLRAVQVFHFNERIRSFLFKTSAKEVLEYLTPEYAAVQAGATAVADSAALHTVLETLLAIGNYINGGTSSGQAYGFKLDVLVKIADFKSVDNKTTLLQYLARKLQEKGVCEKLVEEMKAVGPAGNLPLSALATDIQELNVGLNELTSEVRLMQNSVSVEEDSSNSSSTGSNINASLKKKGVTMTPAQKEAAKAFLKEVSPFHAEIQEALPALQKKRAEVEKQVSDLVIAYNEDPKKLSSDEFFKMFSSFVATVDKTVKDMLAEEERKRKAAERKAKDEERMKLVRARAATIAPSVPKVTSMAGALLHASVNAAIGTAAVASASSSSSSSSFSSSSSSDLSSSPSQSSSEQP